MNGELILITLNKLTPPLWISEENLSVLFYATPFLSQKSVLIEWRWVCCQLTYCWFLVSLEALWRLAGPSVTLGLSLRIIPKKKNWAIECPGMHVRNTIKLCIYYYVFLMSSYIFKMFLLAMFGKLTIVLVESSLWFETAMKLHKRALKRNCRKLRDTRHCFNVYKMFTWHPLTLVNARSYDDILSVCWSVPKIPPRVLNILLTAD